jgi:hypothetical protein
MIEIIPKVDVKILIESLSRMGIVNEEKKIIWPSCYYYFTNNKHWIVHFKEIFAILNKENSYNNLTFTDLKRRSAICFLLQNWKLLTIVNPEEIENHQIKIFVLPHSLKKEYSIIHKINKNLLYNLS